MLDKHFQVPLLRSPHFKDNIDNDVDCHCFFHSGGMSPNERFQVNEEKKKTCYLQTRARARARARYGPWAVVHWWVPLVGGGEICTDGPVNDRTRVRDQGALIKWWACPESVALAGCRGVRGDRAQAGWVQFWRPSNTGLFRLSSQEHRFTLMFSPLWDTMTGDSHVWGLPPWAYTRVDCSRGKPGFQFQGTICERVHTSKYNR